MGIVPCPWLLLVFALSVLPLSFAFAEGNVTQSPASTVSIAPGISGLTATTWQKADPVAEKAVNSWMRDLYTGFVPNRGQIADATGKSAAEVLYSATVQGAQVYVTTSGISHYFLKNRKRESDRSGGNESERIEWCRLDMLLKGASIRPDQAQFEDPITELGSSNYYLPQCPNGVLDLATYRKITFHDVYPGIDWVVQSKPGLGVQSDFVVHPGADPALIRMLYEGAQAISVSDDSSMLHVRAPLGEIQEGALNCYQRRSTE